MERGLLKLVLRKISLPNDGPIGEKSYIIRAKLGALKAHVKAKGHEANLMGDYNIFRDEGSKAMEFYVFEKDTDDLQVFGSVPLEEILKEQETVHHIKVNLVYKKGGKIEQRYAGFLVVELKYAFNLKRSVLDIRVDKAHLLRDTELIGKMDPFVTLKLGDVIKRTSTLDNAGKDPAWVELYSLVCLNPLDKLTLTVYDEDVTTDDLVGDITIDLQERGVMIDTGTSFKEWIWDIFYEGKKAGEVSVATRFTEVKEGASADAPQTSPPAS